MIFIRTLLNRRTFLGISVILLLSFIVVIAYLAVPSRRWSIVSPLDSPQDKPVLVQNANGVYLIGGGATDTSQHEIRRFEGTNEKWDVIGSTLLAYSCHSAVLLGKGSLFVAGNDGSEVINMTNWDSKKLAFRHVAHRCVALPQGGCAIVGGLEDRDGKLSAPDFNGIEVTYSFGQPSYLCYFFSGGGTLETTVAIPTGIDPMEALFVFSDSDNLFLVADVGDSSWIFSFARENRHWTKLITLPYQVASSTKRGRNIILIGSQSTIHVVSLDLDKMVIHDLHPTLYDHFYSASLIVLKSGNLLLTGGIDAYSGQATDRCEVYHSDINEWKQVNRLNTGRGSHACVQLSDGRVLCIGG